MISRLIQSIAQQVSGLATPFFLSLELARELVILEDRPIHYFLNNLVLLLMGKATSRVCLCLRPSRSVECRSLVNRLTFIHPLVTTLAWLMALLLYFCCRHTCLGLFREFHYNKEYKKIKPWTISPPFTCR